MANQAPGAEDCLPLAACLAHAIMYSAKRRALTVPFGLYTNEVSEPNPAPDGTNRPAYRGMSAPASTGAGHHAPAGSSLGSTGTGLR